MSVIVKGMEMPDGCENCLLRYRSQGMYCTDRCYATVVHKNIDPWTFGRTRNGDKPDWCPLHPMPEKHGRLIDGDALRGKMYHDAFETDSEMQRWDSGCWIRYKMFENNIDDAETIVEAEGD